MIRPPVGVPDILNRSPSLFSRHVQKNIRGYRATTAILEMLQYSLDVCLCLPIRRETTILKDGIFPSVIGC